MFTLQSEPNHAGQIVGHDYLPLPLIGVSCPAYGFHVYNFIGMCFVLILIWQDAYEGLHIKSIYNIGIFVCWSAIKPLSKVDTHCNNLSRSYIYLKYTSYIYL